MPPTVQSAPSPATWKLTLAYDGTDYYGWQVQPGKPTIQGELQAALGRITGEAPLPQGSGRTDAGVHALAQVASFALLAPIPAESLQRALNRTLPPAIRISQARPVRSTFHARHSARAKVYEYRVFRGSLCPPFLARYVYAFPRPLDFDLLNASARLFVGEHDFRSFAASDPDLASRGASPGPEPATAPQTPQEPSLGRFRDPGTVRTIFTSEWRRRQTADGEFFLYRVRGSGFLHHMVRNLAGVMLEVARGSLALVDIPRILAARDRAQAGPTAPARGLFLHSVEYDPADE
ncbi:MAG: tRNA pseudouridine synthase A [Acidobacteriota bacterium]